MKIAFIANTSWSMVNFRKGILERLVKDGHDVWILAPEDNHSSFFAENNIKFQKLALSQYGNNISKELLFIYRLYKLAKEHQFDLIFNYTLKLNIYSTFVGRLLTTPCIMVVTGLGYYSNMRNSLKKLLIFYLHKLSANLATQLWVLNSHDSNYFSKQVKISPKKITCLNGEGINLDYFKRQATNYPANQTFLFAARLIKEKGIYQFIESIRLFNKKNTNHKIQFKIAGFLCPNYPNAVTQQELDQWVKEGLIENLGSKADIRPEIEKASCIVLPSFYGEGMSRIIMESLAMKVPVISTYNKGCEELIIHKKTGYLIEKENVEQLVEAFEYMAGLTEQQLKTMGEHCLRFVANSFNEKNIINIYLNAVRLFDKATITQIQLVPKKTNSKIETI